MKDELYKQISELVLNNERTSHTGRTSLPTPIIKKIANLLGGNYTDLNKIQKDIFRSDCTIQRLNDWEYYTLL